MIPLIIQDQFTIQDLQRSPISQTSNWSGTFFAVFTANWLYKMTTNNYGSLKVPLEGLFFYNNIQQPDGIQVTGFFPASGILPISDDFSLS